MSSTEMKGAAERVGRRPVRMRGGPLARFDDGFFIFCVSAVVAMMVDTAVTSYSILPTPLAKDYYLTKKLNRPAL